MSSQPISILSVVGTRPNLMKAAPLVSHLTEQSWCTHTLLHTGQHFDHEMSQTFFDQLGLQLPDIHLDISGGRVADQAGRIMTALDGVMNEHNYDLVFVYGDVNSTFAASYCAAQNGIQVAHVEAGLRSFDRSMPEEINRICTDAMSDLLLTTHQVANDNLASEGVAADKIHLVGNLMIDSLINQQQSFEACEQWTNFELSRGNYAVLTLHRPGNVDTKTKLEPLIDTVLSISADLPILMPVHPRTQLRLEEFGLFDKIRQSDTFITTDPLGYRQFMSLVVGARVVLTDSGGVQEETTHLGIPCLTLRPNTERPFTIDQGTNRLVATNPEAIRHAFTDALAKSAPNSAVTLQPLPRWDGKCARRIGDLLQTHFQ